MSDTKRLCEEAERLAASFRDPEKKQNLHLAQTLTDLVTAPRVERERAEKAEKERDAARAELARLTTTRPIAEAPRDGTRILAYMPSTETWMVLVWLVPKRCWACPDFPHVGYYDPTHFLPLPAEGGQR